MARKGSRSLRLVFVALSGLWLASGWAQTYPTRTIRFVSPGSAGDGADVLARIVAGELGKIFNQQVIVENRAGASGNIAAEFVARAPADGYTLLQLNINHASNVSLYRNLSYDVVRDFAAVTQIASAPAVLVVHPSLPVRSVKDLIALAKAKPGAINYGSAGEGSSAYLGAETFKYLAGVNLLHVPYRGGGPALTGLITGETSVMFAPPGSSLPHIQQRRLRPLAVTTPARFPALPDYPTVAEAGLPGYEFSNWYGLVAPAMTPREAITTLHGAVVTALRQPEVNKRLTDLGYIPVGNKPEEFAAYIGSEVARLAKVIQQSRITK